MGIETTDGSTSLQVASEGNHQEVIVWLLLRRYPAVVLGI